MKLLKNSLLSAFFFSLFAIACTKETSSFGPDTSNLTTNNQLVAETNIVRKVDRITYRTGAYTQYAYDANGRCSSVKNTGLSYITYYKYNSDKVVATLVYTDPTKPSLVKTYTLNALGLAATCTYTSGTTAYLSEYQYDSGKRLTKATNKSKANTSTIYKTDNTYIYTYNSSGNCTRRTYQLTFVNVMYDYTYDTNHLNTLGNDYKGLEWLGKNSTHIENMMLIIEGHYYPNWDSKLTWIYYTLAFDPQGYTIKQTSRDASTSDIMAVTYR